MSKSKSTKKKSALPDTHSETKISEGSQDTGGIVPARKSSKRDDSSLDTAAKDASCSADNSSDYMKNSILEEILNEKKAALLQSPEVMKLLREQQLKLQK